VCERERARAREGERAQERGRARVGREGGREDITARVARSVIAPITGTAPRPHADNHCAHLPADGEGSTAVSTSACPTGITKPSNASGAKVMTLTPDTSAQPHLRICNE